MKLEIYILTLAISVFALTRCAKNQSIVRSLDDIAERNRKSYFLSDNSKEISGLNSKSKFEGLKQLFRTGVAPPVERFTKEEVLTGKCSFEYEPQSFYGDVLNTYVDFDPVLGTFIYIVPTLLGMPDTKNDKNDLWIPKNNDLLYQHEKARTNLKAFSTLLFQYPLDSAFYHITREMMGNAAYVFYKKGDTPSGRDPTPTLISFRLRVVRQPQGNDEVLVLEHYCHYLEGCEFKGSSRKYHHLEPYAYCYYTEKSEIDLPDKRRNSGRSIPLKTVPPEASKRDKDQDILEE